MLQSREKDKSICPICMYEQATSYFASECKFLFAEINDNNTWMKITRTFRYLDENDHNSACD